MNSPAFLCFSLFTCTLAGPLAAAALYTTGHGDITATYANGELHLSYRLDSASTVDIAGTPGDLADDIIVGAFIGGTPISGVPVRKRFQLGEVVVYIPGPSAARPSGAAYDFIGNDAGDPTWYLPQVQDFAKPWLGFASEEVAASEWSSYALSLVSLTGPANGHVSLTTTGGLGEINHIWTSYPGIDATDTYNIGLQTHAHANWWFSEPGIYEITLRASGVHVTDGPKEALATFTFGVQAVPVPEPSVAAFVLLAGAATLRRRRT